MICKFCKATEQFKKFERWFWRKQCVDKDEWNAKAKKMGLKGSDNEHSQNKGDSPK